MDHRPNKSLGAEESPGQETTREPQVHAVSAPQPIPVFNCIVYVAFVADGKVQARVGNLPGIEYAAASEPAALRLIVTEFKRRLTEWMSQEEPIPWIEPPLQANSHEQQRLIPVHL